MKLRIRVGIPALLTLLWALVMTTVIAPSGLAPYPRAFRFNHDVGSPILAIELAHGKDDIERVLPPAPDPSGEASHRAVRVNTILDLVFIPLYVWYLITLTYAAAPSGALRNMAFALAILAGVFDVVEDMFIFTALNSGTPPIYIPSLIKWAMLGLAIVATGRILVGNHRILYSIATDRLLGAAHLFAGALLVFGVAAGEWLGYSWIQHGTTIYAGTFLITGLYIPLYYIRWLLPAQFVRYVDNFCARRQKGEAVGQAVQPST